MHYISDVDSFDELRFLVYHEKHLQFDIERFPPTSASIKQHILRVYLQCYMWLHASFIEDIQLNPLDYGYMFDDNENLIPLMTTEPSIPDEFPAACNCLKCARPRVCPCRLKPIACCRYCKCGATTLCKNPMNTTRKDTNWDIRK